MAIRVVEGSNYGILAYMFVFLVVLVRLSSSSPSSDEIKDDQLEDKFVELYGRNVNTSGIFQQARDVAFNEPRLRNIAFRIIKMILNPLYDHFELKKVNLTVKTLKFVKREYESINIDVIEIDLLRVFERDEVFHVTKGLEPCCAFFLKQLENAETFCLNEHQCGILNLYA